MKDDRATKDPEVSTKFAPIPGDLPEDGVSAAFRADGDAVAVTTSDGVFVWTLGRGKPTALAADHSVRGPYGRSGRLVLVPDGEGEPDELWNDSPGTTPVPLHVSELVETWHFNGRLLSGMTDLGTLDYNLSRVTDNSAEWFCDLLGQDPPDVKLPPSFDVPPEANMDPPCLSHRWRRLRQGGW